MTSIPANVQKYFAGSRTEQPKAQAADSGQDFGKVLDKQKTGTPKDSTVKTTRQKQTDAAQGASRQEQMQEQPTDAAAAEQPGEGQPISEETVSQQAPAEETAETPVIPQEPQPAEGMPVEALPEEEPQELEQVMEVLQSAVLQVQQLLQQQLDITPQELEQLMQDKGITELDLLQPETVNQLVLDAAGAEDNLELVMDENLYQSQQTISREFQGISQRLEKELAEDGKELPKVLKELEESVGMSRTPVQSSEETAQNPQLSGGSSQEKDAAARQEKGESRNTTGQVFYQNYTAQAQNPAAGQQVSVMTPTGGSAYLEAQDASRIMNQVLDYMKVSMKPENTVLDMQLHPESLGTLHIQISAREGVMTAHFTASSEAVKTVLENQMVVLKENFLQQDIKVDAIEVTVQTHQFEDNLQQGQQRGEEEAGRRPKRRRLDISSLESGEKLTESEQILTEMMAADGNTVDYLA